MRGKLMVTYAERMLAHDPPALAEWLANLPSSPSRNATIQQVARQIKQSDPETAANWRQLLND